MTWISYAAVYFIIWWVVLFAVLPFGLRTQDEDGDVTLGTTASAPKGSHVRRAMLRATIVATLVFAVLWVMRHQFGWDFDDIPRIVPRFD